MGTEILAHTYQDEKRQTLRLASELPVGLAINDPRFKHFEILRLTEEVSQKLVAHVREYGYESLYEVTLNRLIGNAYANLFAYSGLEEGVFFNWFKEVFESHKAGFLAYTKPFDVDDLSYGVRAVLTKRPDIVRLAGDIFNLYAPKLDLRAVYTDVMPSGGKWRGWDVHQVDSFAHVINLTEEENKEYPATFVPQVFVDEEMGEPYILGRTDEVTGESYVVGENEPSLETQLRKHFSETLVESTYELYSTSHKAFSSPDDISLGTVRYIYDYCLEHRGHGVVGKGKLSFNLARKVKPELRHLLVEKEALLPDYITELYAAELVRPTFDMYAFLYEKEQIIPSIVCMSANPMLALKLFREAVDLGAEIPEYLYEMFHDHGALFFHGTDGFDVNIENAIECFSVAALLNNPVVTKNLILCAERLAYGLGVKRDIPRALLMLREGLARHDKAVTKNTITYILNACGYGFLIGGDDVEKNIDSAIECFYEQVSFGHAGGYTGLMTCARELIIGENFKRNLPKAFSIFQACSESSWHAKQEVANFLNDSGAVMFNGRDGVEKNIDIAIECFQKAIDLGHRDARENLRTCAYGLITSKEGARNKHRAFEILKKSFAMNTLGFKRDAASSLNSIGISLFNGDKNIEKNLDLAIECFQEANQYNENVANKYLIECARVLISGSVCRSVGVEVERDMPKAFGLLRELIAADWFLKDDIAALLNALGSNFFNGEDGFEKDITCAIECFQEAAYLGDKYANDNLVACAKRLIVEKDIRDIEKALKMLREHTTIDKFARTSRIVDFVRRGNTDYNKSDIASIINAFGAAFFNGTQGLEKNDQYAVRFFEEAVRLGDSDARNNLTVYAKSLIIGKYIARDIQKSLRILHQYSENKIEIASFLFECAKVFSSGTQGFEKDAEKANILLKEVSNFYSAAGFKDMKFSL